MSTSTSTLARRLLGLIVLAATLTQHGGGGASILVFLPFSAKSHYIAFNPLLEELLNRGHHMTAYRSIPLQYKGPSKNYREIVLPNFLEDLKKAANFNVVEYGKIGFFGQVTILNEIGLSVCEMTYKSQEFQQLMKSEDKYDLVITEALFSQYSVAALAHKFNAHHVVMMPLGNSHWTNYIMSNPYSASYIPDYNTVSTSRMGFTERLYNTLVSLAVILINQFYFVPKFQTQIDNHFVYGNSETRPHLTKLISNISLVLENSHMSLNGASPKAPNIASVGGLNIKKNEPLPKRLQKWLDEAKNGCIYFSYGTVVEGGHLDDRVRRAYAAAFSKIKQRVIWKIESNVQVPNNVLTDPWMPQQDILAHPNVALFITHGGYLSVNEAIHYGVPLIGTPFYGDQMKNLKHVTESGYGLQLDYNNITEQSVLWAVNEIIGNTKYKDAIQKTSEVYKDRQNTALETAVYWVEYVIRHDGAPHLRPYAAFMPWYEAENLDVAVAMLAAVIITLLMIRKLYLFLTCQTCSRNKIKVDIKSRKQKSS